MGVLATAMAAGHEDTFHHVRDFPHFELPFGIEISLPDIAGLQVTKFMVLQLIAFAVSFLIFRGLAARVASGQPVQGRWWNFWEALALFIRDEVVRPTIGDSHHGHDEHGHADHAHEYDNAKERSSVYAYDAEVHGELPHDTSAGGHPADKYLPFIWSCFFYVLICNLLGAIPWMGSATGEINVTGALALVVLGYVVIAGTGVSGVAGFWKSLAPTMDLPGPLPYLLTPMIWLIELGGLFIKHGVLAVRLFANIMAGHTVIAVVLGFIAMAANSSLWYAVAPASVFAQVGIGLLELFVAFLQAYVFAFLTTLFISAAVHPH